MLAVAAKRVERLAAVERATRKNEAIFSSKVILGHGSSSAIRKVWFDTHGSEKRVGSGAKKSTGQRAAPLLFLYKRLRI